MSSLSTFYASRAFRGNQGGRLPLYMRPNNYGIPLAVRRNPDAVTNGRRRRRRRRTGVQGLEINRAEGGFKSIVSRGKVQMRGINLYGRLAVTKIGDDWTYLIQPEWNNYAGTVNVDLVDGLNKSEEFLNLCQHSSQYKVLFFNTTLDYQRIPEAKDRLSRLLMTVSTDKVKVERPKLEQNVMNLSMTQPGVKNFNFRLNGRNMDPLNLAWQNAEYLYAGNVVLEVDGQDKNHMNDDSETTYVLGTLKVTIGVLFRLQDYEKINQPRTFKPNPESNEKKINEVTKLTMAIDEEIKSIKKEIAARFKTQQTESFSVSTQKPMVEVSTQTEPIVELKPSIVDQIAVLPVLEVEKDKYAEEPIPAKEEEKSDKNAKAIDFLGHHFTQEEVEGLPTEELGKFYDVLGIGHLFDIAKDRGYGFFDDLYDKWKEDKDKQEEDDYAYSYSM